MNVLFLTIGGLSNIDDKGIYTDLLRNFCKNGHSVYAVSSRERKLQLNTQQSVECGVNVLRVKIGNITKVKSIEKGISTLMIEKQFKSAIKKYHSDVKFDLVMYSTPPITFANVIKYIKKRDNAKSYLLLKDIFPQNAVDLGMFSKKSPIHMLFRKKETQLYKISDYIGCMSQANVDFIIKNNPSINPSIVHISPNTVELEGNITSSEEKVRIRKKYNIPIDKRVFIYGGNLGKPQGIDFLVRCLKDNINKEDSFFVVSGTGTEYHKIKSYVDEFSPKNMILINGLPKDEYENIVKYCDVGLIFLDHRFTIPNFPSRLLSYMQNSMPVIACTDKNTDIGQVIVDGGFGWWCESTDEKEFTQIVDVACAEDLSNKARNSRKCLEDNYTVDKSYEIIMEKAFFYQKSGGINENIAN